MRLALLGDPVAHSLSPAIQNAALAAARIPGTYEPRKVDGAGVREAFDELRSGALDGANVTMPHKRLAAELCDEIDPQASRAGAVNTLVRVGGAVIGHNTDIAGICRAWRRVGLPTGSPVLVLGTGGAAAAALLALEGSEIFVSGRRVGAAAELAVGVGVAATEVDWGSGVAGAVIVNATPLGMRGEALHDAVLAAGTALFDMAYGPEETPAAGMFRGRGQPVVAGTDLLVAQAVESFRLWTGRQADEAAMVTALASPVGEGRGVAMVETGQGPAQ